MRELFTKESLVLEPGCAVSGIAAQAQTLRILRGQVWITVEGVAHDYWLSAGDSFRAIPGRLIVIEAGRAPSRLDVVAAGSASMLAQMRRRLGAAARRLAPGKHGQGAPQCARCGP